MTYGSKHSLGVEQYVRDIHQYALLSREEENELAHAFQKQGDVEASRQLILANLRFVLKIAHEYSGYNMNLLDLVQEGNIGLMMAVRKFEPDRGYRLISYAVWWIRAYIQNYVIRTWSLIKVGTTQTQRKLFFRLRAEREKMVRMLGSFEQRNLAQLAASLGVSEQDVIDMEVRLEQPEISLDMEVPGYGNHHTYLDLLQDEQQTDMEHSFAQAEERAHIHQWLGDAMAAFNDKERYIVKNRLMAEEPQTLQEIGHHFHISRERARQIEGNVLRKMKHMLLESELVLARA